MKEFSFFLLFAIVIGWTSCMPYEEDTLTTIKLDYSDKALQQLMEYKDKRMTDSLLVYLEDKNPTYRYAAALGIASSKDKDALSSLYTHLSDPVDHVKGSIAFAIGQIGDSLSVPYLVKAFNNFDSLRVNNFSNSQILEAVGKCGTVDDLINLSTSKPFHEKDTLVMLGQARGIYRMAARRIHDPSATQRMLDYTCDYRKPDEVRLMAAHYFQRARGINLDSSVIKLCKLVKDEPLPNIRMTMVTGIAKSKLDFGRDTLINMLSTEKDYRVKCNIINAFRLYEYKDVKDAVFALLYDENPNVSMTAANFLYNHGIPEDGKLYRNFARESENTALKIKLYSAANHNLSYYFTQAKSGITMELSKIFNETKDVQTKVAILDAMSEFEWNYPQMKKLGLDTDNPELKTAGTNGLIKILGSENFDKVFGLGKRRVSNEIRAYLVEAIRSKDAGSIAVAADAIADKKMGFKSYFEESGFTFLDTVLTDLPIPKEIESYKAVEKAIAHLKGLEKKPNSKPDYNHPIEWDMVEVLNNRTRGIIQTNKGKIVIEFFSQQAPASASNFIRLTKDGYYNGKVIHRVVPNFVVQGGCNRGDGYGSEDFSIRSEFTPALYYNDEGYIGMASAGNDTESTQWFITHSPTPHLDGNYTIFGKVRDGMDVVHQLEIGDVIEKADIKF